MISPTNIGRCQSLCLGMPELPIGFRTLSYLPGQATRYHCRSQSIATAAVSQQPTASSQRMPAEPPTDDHRSPGTVRSTGWDHAMVHGPWRHKDQVVTVASSRPSALLQRQTAVNPRSRNTPNLPRPRPDHNPSRQAPCAMCYTHTF